MIKRMSVLIERPLRDRLQTTADNLHMWPAVSAALDFPRIAVESCMRNGFTEEDRCKFFRRGCAEFHWLYEAMGKTTRMQTVIGLCIQDHVSSTIRFFRGKESVSEFTAIFDTDGQIRFTSWC